MTEDRPTDPALPPERARIEPSAPTKRMDALPILYLAGFLILASALIYLWRHPGLPRGAAQEAARVETLRAEMDARKQESAALIARLAQLETLDMRLKALETRPAPAAPDVGAALGAALGPVAARVKALEDKPAAAAVDFGPLEARLKGLEDKPAPAPTDLGPLDARVKALEGKPPPPVVDLGPLEASLASVGAKLASVETKLAAVEAQAKQSAAGLAATAEKAQRSQKLITATAALEAGQRLGDIAGAPASVAKFAHDAPPTESALRLSFNQAAEAAHRASQPAGGADRPFLDRMWSRAQQSVTVRQGDQVLVGDPSAGVLARARMALDAGDLPGAVAALAALDAPAKAAMAEWLGRAQSLLDARAGLAEMAARS